MLPIMGLGQNKFSVGANANIQMGLMTIKAPQAIGGIEEKGGIGIGYSLGIQAQYDYESAASTIETGITLRIRMK
jgi:hypothetical protein